MKQKVNATGAPDKLVIVQTTFQTPEKHAVCFAFTSRQVLEVRTRVKTRPVPFAESFLLGLCPWKNRILPVLDLEARFGLQGEQQKTETRYLVVRTGVPVSQATAGLDYAIVKVPARISILATRDTPAAPAPAGVEMQPVRGIFHYENQVLLVPDLAKILHTENGHS